MDKSKILVVLATVGLIMGCCIFPPSDSDEHGESGSGINSETNAVQDVGRLLERESVQDDNFDLYFDEDPDKCTFKPRRSGATLADLANFAMQTCWTRRLSRKFGVGSGEQLTDNDVKLAEFCLDVHFMFLDTLSVAMLNDLTQDDKIVRDYCGSKSPLRGPYQNRDLRPVDKLDKEIDPICDDLKEHFLKSKDSPIRNCIRDWGEKFQAENAQEVNWLSVYSGIYNQMPSVDLDKIRENHKSWLWMPRIVGTTRDVKIEVSRQQPDNGVATVETAEAWAVMESMTRRYLDSLNSIYETIRKHQACLSLEDHMSLERAQSIIRKKGANVRAYNRFFRGALYDMPLTFYSLRGYAGVYANWHWYGDDEEAMFDAAKYMVMGIRGVKMIENARSLYSVHAYNSTVSLLKNKLSEAEFKTLLTDTKMYHVDISDDPIDSNRCVEYGMGK